jgi:hypothetical protein
MDPNLSSHSSLCCHHFLLLGMRAGGPRRFQHRSSPSHMNPDEPSLYDDDRDTTSRWAEAKIISVPEVLVLDDVARRTRVTPSFVRHRNICKSQRTVMTP